MVISDVIVPVDGVTAKTSGFALQCIDADSILAFPKPGTKTERLDLVPGVHACVTHCMREELSAAGIRSHTTVPIVI